MEKKDILQFEADDTSREGINGKQVFFTKRINGKTTHNKIIDGENQRTINQQNTNEVREDLFIDFRNMQESKKEGNKNNKTNIKKKNSKAKKKNKKKKRIIKLSIILVLITGCIIFALVSPIFNIEKIEVEGNEKIEDTTIESLSEVELNKNIFKINKKDIIKKIKENTYINSVSIKRKLPNTLKIIVNERKIAYEVKVINSFIYLDYQGYILEVSSNSAKVPQIIGLSTNQDTLLNGKRLSNQDITSYLNTLLKIKETAENVNIWNLINTINIENNKYTLELNSENKKVYLGNATNLTNMMMYVKVILKEEKGNKGEIFVNGDLNSGFNPYFREAQEEKDKNSTNESKK